MKDSIKMYAGVIVMNCKTLALRVHFFFDLNISVMCKVIYSEMATESLFKL